MEGLIKEKTLAKKTGVNRMLLVRERKKSLNYPDDWQKDGREIVYTETGLKHMMNILNLANEKIVEPIPQNKDLEEVFVVRHNYPNYKIILCERENGEHVHVRVSHNRNFRTRMANGERMKVSIKRDKNTWVFAGKRTPRFPGKW
tara:strand:+ start:552 stop:986 length:435 start_codon:yes stop_codon:yes gene_type:complete